MQEGLRDGAEDDGGSESSRASFRVMLAAPVPEDSEVATDATVAQRVCEMLGRLVTVAAFCAKMRSLGQRNAQRTRSAASYSAYVSSPRYRDRAPTQTTSQDGRA